MPYITIESGALSDEQKENLIKRLTEVSSEIMNVPQEFFSVTIKELPDKNFGIGGKTIDKVKSEYMENINKFQLAARQMTGNRLHEFFCTADRISGRHQGGICHREAYREVKAYHGG